MRLLALLLVACSLAAQVRSSGGSTSGRVDFAKPPNIGQKWTNRGPIAQLFIAVEADRTATNPGGYLGPDWGNPSDIDMFDHTTMMAAFTDAANRVVALLGTLPVQPQGIVIWDVEGVEMLKYIGNPSLVEFFSPYALDGIDEMISIFIAAGYRVGFTIRTKVPYGTQLPATCFTHPTQANLRERFFEYDAPYDDGTANCLDEFGQPTGPGCSRGRICTTTANVWTLNQSVNFPFLKFEDPYPFAVKQIQYALNRWGPMANIFYWDTNFIVGYGAVPAGAQERIMRAFPDILLVPEHQFLNHPYYRNSAPFLTCDSSDGIAETPTAVRASDPLHFSWINCMRTKSDFEFFFDEAVRGVRNGDIIGIKSRTSGATLNIMAANVYEEALTPWDGQVPEEPIQDELVRWYKFDEGAGQQLTDYTAGANHGQLGATSGVDATDPTWTAQGLSFTSHYATFPSFTNDDMTIMVAAQRTIGASTGAVIADNVSNVFTISSVPQLLLTGGVQSINRALLTTPDDGLWRVYTLRYSRGKFLGIIVNSFQAQEYDGELQDSAFTVSRFGAQSTTGIFWKGAIGYALMYTKELTRAEVKANYAFIQQELAARGINLSGTSYYLDSVSGNDSNLGTSPAQAWRTISKVNSSSFSASDKIFLKRGQRWREQLTFPSSGVFGPGNRITVSPFGTGANPVLDGSDLFTGWSNAGSNRWTKSTSIQPGKVWFNGTRGTEEASQGAVDASLEWFWGSNTLTVYSEGDPATIYTAPGVEVPQRSNALLLDNKSYLVFDGIDLVKANGANAEFTGTTATNIEFMNGNILDAGEDGVVSVADSLLFHDNYVARNGDETGTPIGHGILVTTDSTVKPNSWEVNDNEFDSNARAGILCELCGAPGQARRNYVHNNGEEGIVVSEVAAGDGVGSGTIVVNHNIVHSNGAEGLRVNDSDGSAIVATGDGFAGIAFINNVSALNNIGLVISDNTAAAYITIANNIFYQNTLQAATTSTSGNLEFENNLYYKTAGGAMIHFQGDDYTNAEFADYQSATNHDLEGLSEDPLFTNPGAFDFTLQTASNAVDSGWYDNEVWEAAFAILSDINGAGFPQGNGPDLGAHEQ